MSLNITPVRAALVLDPRLNIATEKDYAVLKGASVNSFQQFPSTTASSSNVQITCNPPSRSTAISRLVFKEVIYNINVTGTNTSGGPLLISGYYGPRFMPALSTTTSETITIDNASISAAPLNDYMPALLWYHNQFHNSNGQYSLAPSMKDQSQRYEDAVQTTRNPLANYFANAYESSRGGYPGLVIAPGNNGNGATSVNLTLTTYEPIFLSPLVFGKESNYTSALIGVMNMSYTATFGDLSRVLSLVQNPVAGVTLNTPTVTIPSNGFSLFFNYLTPDPLVMPIPRNIECSYFSLISYPTKSSTSVAPGASVSLTMNSVQLSSIPRRIYVFVGRDNTAKTAFNADSYFALNPNVNPVTLTWNNNIFLSQSTTQDLYNMSYKNGIEMSYSQFTNYTGSILCIDLGTDIGLDSASAPGTLMNVQFGFTGQFINTNTVDTITPTMRVVVVSEGVFSITNGSATQMLGVLSQSDILDAKVMPSVTYKRTQDVYGGTFFSKLKGLARRGNDFLKRSKVLSRTLGVIPHPYAKIGSVAADALGYGVSGGRRLRGAGLTDKQIKNKITARDLASDDEKEEDSGSNSD